MTAGRRYLVGVIAVAAAALVLSFVLPPGARTAVWLATALALIVQGPLAGGSAAAKVRAPASRSNEIDIMAHLGNSHSIELPSWKSPYYTEVELPRLAPIRIGHVTIDLSPTKHAVFLALAAGLVALVFLYT